MIITVATIDGPKKFNRSEVASCVPYPDRTDIYVKTANRRAARVISALHSYCDDTKERVDGKVEVVRPSIQSLLDGQDNTKYMSMRKTRSAF
jgi:hypothetical protein